MSTATEAKAPTRLKAREFEKLLVQRHNEYRKNGLASIGRYGVQCSHVGDKVIPIQSYPDFEGIATGKGFQIIFDAKVCSQASFALAKYRHVKGERPGARRRQLKHMYERSEFGAVCFFLVHWNARNLTTKTEPAETYIFPVDARYEFWTAFEKGEVKSFNRSDCQEHGTRVEWTIQGRARTYRPDWLVGLNDEVVE